MGTFGVPIGIANRDAETINDGGARRPHRHRRHASPSAAHHVDGAPWAKKELPVEAHLLAGAQILKWAHGASQSWASFFIWLIAFFYL